MQLPSTDPSRQEVKDALRALRDDPRFAVVTAWVKDELRLLDKANRVIGYENKTSEAECLADFLEIVAASAAPDGNAADGGEAQQKLQRRAKPGVRIPCSQRRQCQFQCPFRCQCRCQRLRPSRQQPLET